MKKIIAVLFILTLSACVTVKRRYKTQNYPGLYPNYYRPGYPVYKYEYYYYRNRN